MIPKKIHYCWFGSDPLGALQEKCLQSWKEHLPHYEFRRWSAEDLPLHIPYVKKMYARKRWAYLTDYMRLYALFEYGGFYMDLDVELLKPLDDLLENRFVSAYENVSNQMLECHLLGSEPKHPFLSDGLDFYRKDFRLRWSHPPVVPKMMTQIAKKKYGYNSKNFTGKERLLSEGIRVFPFHYFSPLPYDARKEEDVSKYLTEEKTYAIHYWDYGWKPQSIPHRLRNLPWAFMSCKEWWGFFKMCFNIFKRPKQIGQ